MKSQESQNRKSFRVHLNDSRDPQSEKANAVLNNKIDQTDEELETPKRTESNASCMSNQRMDFQCRELPKGGSDSMDDDDDLLDFSRNGNNNLAKHKKFNVFDADTSCSDACLLSDVDEEKKNHNLADVSENERVTINISGLRFQTYLKTLNTFPETLLGISYFTLKKYFNND